MTAEEYKVELAKAKKELRLAQANLRHLEQGNPQHATKEMRHWLLKAIQAWLCKQGEHPRDQLQNKDLPSKTVQCRLCERWAPDPDAVG